MASKKNAERRRRLQNNPSVHPEMRFLVKQLNDHQVFGTTTTSTTTTTTTTTT